MKLLLAISPTILLVVYSQLITKWRVEVVTNAVQLAPSKYGKLFIYLTDPYIISSYIAALMASIAWIFVVERYAVSVVFPLYIGLTVLLVVIGGIALLDEDLTTTKIISIIVIIMGVAIGCRA